MKWEAAKPTKMELKFSKSPSKIDRGVAIIIYADPGKGKTTLATTLPAEDTLIINTEAGLGPTLGKDHVIFHLKDEINQADEIIRYLNTEKHPFKNIVVDNVSELEQWIILQLTTSRRKEFTELKEYGDASNKLRALTRNFRDLVYKGMNVIFNAWESPIDLKNKDGEIVTKIFPKVTKKFAPEFCGIVDVVGHLEVYEKTGERWIRFGQTDQYITKSQFKGVDDAEPADLPTLIAKIKAYDYEVEDVSKKKKTAVIAGA